MVAISAFRVVVISAFRVVAISAFRVVVISAFRVVVISTCHFLLPSSSFSSNNDVLQLDRPVGRRERRRKHATVWRHLVRDGLARAAEVVPQHDAPERPSTRARREKRRRLVEACVRGGKGVGISHVDAIDDVMIIDAVTICMTVHTVTTSIFSTSMTTSMTTTSMTTSMTTSLTVHSTSSTLHEQDAVVVQRLDAVTEPPVEREHVSLRLELACEHPHMLLLLDLRRTQLDVAHRDHAGQRSRDRGELKKEGGLKE